MKISHLIETVLACIRHEFYRERIREFKRDERALMRAVATWGYACAQRGWELDAQFILEELLGLLGAIKKSGAEIGYLPSYLQGAVKRRIGQRAEEISAQSKSTPRQVAKIVQGLKGVDAVREPGAVETLAMLYRDLRRPKRSGPKAPKQGSLL